MKALIITPRFFPEIGGVEKHTYFLSNELSQYFENIEIITRTERNDLPIREQIGLLKINRIRSKKGRHILFGSIVNKLKIWFYFLENYGVLQESSVIHLNDFETFLWIFPFVPFLRSRLFITFHGFEGYPIHASSRAIRKIAERAVKGNICIGKFITKWYGTKSRYISIGAVDPPKKSSFVQNNEIIFVGRLERDTGILELIETIRILKTDYSIEMSLHICGDGKLRETIQQTSMKNRLNVHMHGFMTCPQQYILQCRYSFATGYLSILEAMSFKKIVLSIYNNPLKKDYLYSIQNAELLMLIAPSPIRLAKELYSAIKNPEAVELMSERAYTFALQQTWHKLAFLYLKLWCSDE